jgi:Kef-type K+ transport system membrane component KefB
MAFIVPFFFVVTGTKVDVGLLADWSVIGTVLVVTALAIVSKLAGCGLGARSLGKKSALIVGVGMVPRGEVGIIVASLGQQAKVFPASTYAVIIAMSLLTSVVAPPALKRLLRDTPSTEEPDEWTAAEMDRRAEACESTRTG